MKVLVTDGNNGQSPGALSAVRALAATGHEVHVTRSGRFSTAAWSRHSRRSVLVPTADQPSYADTVRALVETERYDVVLPASDAAMLALGSPGAELVDKEHLHARAQAAGIATPEQWAFEHGDDAAAGGTDVRWPVVVKPVTKTSQSTPPAFRAESPADLGVLRGVRDPVVLEEWLAGEQRAVAGVMWKGRLRAVVHQRYVRTWPRDCGVAAHAVTTGPDEDLEHRLESLLAGYDGMFQCQLLDGRLHDANPRVYGSLSLAVKAGVNLPDVWCRLTVGEDVGDPDVLRARPGVRYRWVEGELRHLAQARRSGELTGAAAIRALRPRRGTAHSDLWVSDPGPSLARVAFALRARGVAR